MELTIKKPAVIEPSHMPRTKRTAKRPAKFLQAACAQRAIAQIKMLKLDNKKLKCVDVVELLLRIPHPFSHWKMLETEILGKLESQVTQVENRAEPSIKASST